MTAYMIRILETLVQSRSLLEWIKHLRAKARRKASVGDAVGVRQDALRHVEGAECKIDQRKGRSEIFLPAALCRGVMPAVKDRTGNRIFERPQRPVQIRMHEAGVCDGEGAQEHQNVGGNS